MACRLFITTITAAALLETLVGCTNVLDTSFLDVIQHDLSAATDLERSSIMRTEAPAVGAPQLNMPDMGMTMNAEDYVTLALARHPSIRSAEQKVRRLLERVPQAESLDDPNLRLTPIGDMSETAAGQVQAQSSLSQKLPFPGKLATRGRIAAQEAAIAQKELDSITLTVIGDTRRAYWSLYFAVRSIEVTEEDRTLLDQLREVAQAKYRVGTTTQQAVLRASVELNNIENELITLEQRRITASAMLNTMIDRPVTEPLPDPAPIDLTRIDASLDDLLRQAAISNPSIQRFREQFQRFREQRELARLDRFPDLTASVSYNIVDGAGLSSVANGNDQWWIGLGINLPIWEKKLKAAELEATRGVLEAASALAFEQNLTAFRVQDAFIRVDTQQRQVALLRDVIVPEARQTVESSLSGYRAGDLDFLTLVDNWRKLLDFQLLLEQSLSDLEQSFASLQEAVGHDLHRDGTAKKNTLPKPITRTAPDSEDK